MPLSVVAVSYCNAICDKKVTRECFDCYRFHKNKNLIDKTKNLADTKIQVYKTIKAKYLYYTVLYVTNVSFSAASFPQQICLQV